MPLKLISDPALKSTPGNFAGCVNPSQTELGLPPEIMAAVLPHAPETKDNVAGFLGVAHFCSHAVANSLGWTEIEVKNAVTVLRNNLVSQGLIEAPIQHQPKYGFNP